MEKSLDVRTAIAKIYPNDSTQGNQQKSQYHCYKAISTRLLKLPQSTQIHWTDNERPVYTSRTRSVQPPTQEQCEMLISHAKGALSLKIHISMQTGLRPIEVVGEKGLRVKDIHFEQKTITPLSTKGCNARPPLTMTEELCARIKTYIQEKKLDSNDPLFNMTSKAYSDTYRRSKNRLAKKMQDPTLKSIRLYDLRHYYVTKQLRKCQNAES